MIGKSIKFYLNYFVYFLITIEERRNFLMAETRGYDCIGSKDDSYMLYGSVTKYTFDKSSLPKRHYITFKEYKKIHYKK